MADPFLADITMVGFNFAPRGWALCDGQLLPINQNQALFSLLGTTYGGDGRTSFALPDLRGRTPIGFNTTHPEGARGGTESVALTLNQIPPHSHAYRATCAAATSEDAINAKPAPSAARIYRGAGEISPLHPNAVTAAGGDQGHNNMQPYTTLNFVIALVGVFPSRT